MRAAGSGTLRAGLLRALLTLLAGLALSACAGLPRLDPPPRPSRAIALSVDTPLGGLAVRSLQALAAVPAGPLSLAPQSRMPDGTMAGLTGFRLLPLGLHALDARLQLARQAQASLDLQYYHFADDGSGRALLRALRDAAARGVRVRLLIDDLYTGGADALWQSFMAHDGVELRLFNPFATARGQGVAGRFALAPWDWGRINHRMHNKLFVADGAWAVFGGRNIADEYFLARPADNFIDIDVLAAGALVPALQGEFDRYWNAATAYPATAVLGPVAADAGERLALRRSFDALTDPSRSAFVMPDRMALRDVLGQSAVGQQLEEKQIALLPGYAEVLADRPEKPFEGSPGGELMMSSVTWGVYNAMMQARREVLASSPYFIPGRVGLGLFEDLRARGVHVAVLTNSLKSTDEPLAHLAYARYRQPLLAAGVELSELSQRRVKDNMQMFLFGESLGRLHAKTVVVDQQLSFVGSMNLDPRSATLNTELGALIDSPPLAAQIKRLIDSDRVNSAYALRLTADGRCCEWLVPETDGRDVLSLEPDAPWWLRWLGRVLRPLAPEDNL